MKEDASILVEKQRFYTAEFEQEAAWLSFMHREGWKFLSTNGYRYRFEATEKEDWCYQLDYKQNGIAEDDYLQMYRDFGWEFAGQYQNWFYFRKKRTGDEDTDLSVFSDRESKLELCRRIINGQFLRALPVFLCMPLPLYLLATALLKSTEFIGKLLIGIAFFSYACFLLLFIVNYFGQMSRLNKMKNNLDENR